MRSVDDRAATVPGVDNLGRRCSGVTRRADERVLSVVGTAPQESSRTSARTSGTTVVSTKAGR